LPTKSKTQKSFKIYATNFNLKSLDDDIVEGYISTGDPDAYKDIVTDECMDDMAEQMKTKVLKADIEHESFLNPDGTKNEFNITKIPVGKTINSTRDSKGIKVKTLLNKAHSRYTEVKNSIKNGFLDAFSIAFVPVDFNFKSIDGVKHRILHKVNLLNVAYTGIPVNENATFTNVILKSLESNEEDKTLIGGINMAEEEKKDAEVKDVPKTEEVTDAKPEATPEVKPEATPEATETKGADLSKEIAEVKSLAEAKAKENEDLKLEVKALTEKYAKLDEFLSAPQFKAKMEQMDVVLKADAVKKEAELKATTGPIDTIR